MKRIGVLTGGGDTSALNATLKGVCVQAEALGWDVIGFMRGWAGVLDTGEYVRLESGSINAELGGTILKTSRTKLDKIEGGYEQAIRNIKKLDISGLIAIGGDDTLSVARKLEGVRCVVITKTIDNDVGTNAPDGPTVDYEKIINYYTPGYPSAAARMAEFIGMANGLRTTAYSHDRIIVMETMGMSAGWLALAAAYGHPDFIIVPEAPLDYEAFIPRVLERYRERSEVVIAISEGAVGTDGKVLFEDEENVDQFGHKKLGGCAQVVARKLKDALQDELGTRNFNAVIPGYLCRCGAPTAVDRDNAIAIGREAVKRIHEGADGLMSCLMRKGDELIPASVRFDVLPHDEDGALVPRALDSRFYDAESMSITPAGIEYLKPILGPMPAETEVPRLDVKRVSEAG